MGWTSGSTSAQFCFTSLLSGPSQTWACPLAVYHSMSTADSQNYVKLKTELLKRFMCTSEGFREKFPSLKLQSDEPFTSFVMCVSHLLERWYTLSDVQDFDRLVDLLLREQILQSCSAELVFFVRHFFLQVWRRRVVQQCLVWSLSQVSLSQVNGVVSHVLTVEGTVIVGFAVVFRGSMEVTGDSLELMLVVFMDMDREVL